MKKIAFAWYELPNYAARMIRAVRETNRFKISVIGTPSPLLQDSLEAELGDSYTLIDGQALTDWTKLNLEKPDVYFQSGYISPAISELGRQCRRSGGKVVCMTDASWTGTMRQRTIDPIRHRMAIRTNYDGLFVAGQQGIDFSQVMGYQKHVVKDGLLGADPSLFFAEEPLSQRKPIILYVGRLSPEKNLPRLLSAFLEFAKTHPDWKLQVCGSGPEEDSLPDHPQIEKIPYSNSSEISKLMRKARFFVLPSLRDAWGIVVHEAALSGCALLLSDKVGANGDFARPINSIIFSPTDSDAMLRSLNEAAFWNSEQLKQAFEESIKLSKNFGPEKFMSSVSSFVEELTHNGSGEC